ncbi:MFS transporter [Bacteroidota bacterium]
MSTRSVINIFYDKALSLNYSSVAFYQNAYNIIAIILLPVFGKLIGKVDPRRFTIIPFFAMVGYIFFTGFTSYVPLSFDIWNVKIYLMLLIATIFYGLFFSTMLLSWNIGSSYFGSNEEAGDYQSIHLFGTGVRGAVSPLIGVVVYELFGFSLTFGIAIISLLIAVYIMRWSYKKRVVSSN